MSYYEPQGDYSSPAGGEKTPLLTIWQRVLFSPSVQTFARYLPEADLGRAVLWLVLASLVSAVAAGLPTLIAPQRQLQETMELLREIMPPEFSRELPPMMPGTRTISLGSLLCGIPLGVVLALIGAFIGVGLIHLTAKLLQGEGTYTGTFFLTAAVSAPLTLVTGVIQLLNGLLGMIPVVGVILTVIFGLFSLVLGIYGLVLNAMAVAAAHRFSLGKGFAAVLLPGVVLLLLLCCFVVGFALMGASLGTFFEELQRELGLYLTFLV
ncbi:MAG: Yip1 family protein [Anaerolineae bacterium]